MNSTNLHKSTFPLFIHLSLLVLSLSAYGQQRIGFDWAKQFGGTGTDQGRVVITDKNNDLIIGGNFAGNAYFSNSKRTDTLKSNGGTDGYVAKLTSSGELIWAAKMGSVAAGTEYVYGVAVDDSGNVYATGYFNTSIDLNPDPKDTFNYYTKGSNDIFVVKLDPNGKFIWGKRMGGTGVEIARSIRIGKNGDLFVAGNFASRNCNFHTGTNPADTFIVSALYGYTDMYIACLSNDGEFKWVQRLGSTSISDLTDIALDNEDNVYAGGNFRNELYHNPDSANLSAGVTGVKALSTTVNIFAAKFSAEGNLHWVRGMGGYSGDACLAMHASPEGEVYLTGTTLGVSYFGPDTIIGTRTLAEAFVSKMDSAGNFRWTKLYGASNTLNASAITTDKFNNISFTGYFRGTYLFNTAEGPDSILSTMTSATAYGYDCMVSKLDANGTHVWVKRTSEGAGGKAAYGIHAALDGSIYTTGYFSQKADFDIGTGEADTFFMIPTGTASGMDIFLHKMACTDTSSRFEEVISCTREYSFLGETLTQTGTYTWIFPNHYGCDSTVVLNLTIDEINAVINVNGFTLGTTQDFVAYQWLLNGEAIPGATQREYTVTANGQYRVYVTNENGCSDTSDSYTVSNVGITSPADRQIFVRIHPNPARDILIIQSSGPVSATLSNIEGKQLIKSNKSQLDLRTLATGLYFVTIRDKEGKIIKIEKLVKQ